jgi:hypothetical protein
MMGPSPGPDVTARERREEENVCGICNKKKRTRRKTKQERHKDKRTNRGQIVSV